MNQMLQGQEIESALQRLQDLRSETAKLFIGQQELVTGVICGILSGG